VGDTFGQSEDGSLEWSHLCSNESDQKFCRASNDKRASSLRRFHDRKTASLTERSYVQRSSNNRGSKALQRSMRKTTG
jgi:hypothetical protein